MTSEGRITTPCPVCGLEIDITELKEGIEFDCPLCGGELGTMLLLDKGKLIWINKDEEN